jgi:leader peptidase (prepilin peptidase) / N-methyltransferase
MIRILGTIFAGVLGLAFGSFLNVCLSRWPAGESIVAPRSHCRQCGRTLAWWENIPLVSWLALRGRCRSCRARIGWRYPLVELAVGALWAISASQALILIQNLFTLDVFLLRWIQIDTLHLFGNFIFIWLLVALLFLDAEHLWLPDKLTFPGILLGFVYRFGYFLLHHSFSFQQPDTVPSLLVTLFLQALNILAAAALILLIRWLYWLIRRREGIGLGDAKLMAMLAAWLGLPGTLLAFGLGVVLGALVAVVQLAIPAARTETSGWALKKLPLGTFLCIGGIVSSLWGQSIIAAYLGWAGF